MQGREVVYEKGCVVAFEDWWVYPPSFDPPTGWTFDGYIQPSSSINNYECQITTSLRLQQILFTSRYSTEGYHQGC